MSTAYEQTETASPADQAGSADLVGAAQEEIAALIREVRGLCDQMADDQRVAAANSLNEIAERLRSAGSGSDERPQTAQIVNRTADRIDETAAALRDRSAGELYRDAETFAGRYPLSTALIGGVAGYLLGRGVAGAARDAGRQGGI